MIEWCRLREDVARLCQTLEDEPDGPWILLTEDSYCFSVGLLALWHSGRYAISPPNRQVETLRTLQTRAVGVLSDRADWISEGVCLHPIRTEDEDTLSFSLEACDPTNQAIELYTSGTTGGEKPVVKKIHHLQDEIAEIHSLWGSRCSGAEFFSTASHQHLYGLLFGVLWPLASGQVFHGQQYLDVVSAVSDMRRAGDCVLASVPTHLKRLARYSKVNELIGVCRLVFSSGGPLATATAHALQHDLGDPPLEVLGSTETGGIAWRSQRKEVDLPPWTTFPSVSVAPDPVTGAMRVRSPFVSMGSDDDGYATGDRISLSPQGGFFLEGRIDRVAKIGEKRVDLARMESELHGHEFIEEVALVTVDRDMATRVAAAIVPSDSGWIFLEEEGRRAFGLEIRSRLSESWDPIMHPRFWRMVHQLPEDSVGKLKRTALADLFGKSSQARPSTDLPIVLEEFSGSDFVERSCQVPEDLSCFAGHFPGNPMVPGVLQIDWALDMFSQCFGKVPRVSVIESIKFSASLRPGDAVRITVRLKEDRLYLRLWDEGTEFAKGRIRLSPSARDAGEDN
ncbi:MAG: AMP-binding protein [Myxococcota bacterium]|nr:AMP-binding protein [Myxococcota bacterium]